MTRDGKENGRFLPARMEATCLISLDQFLRIGRCRGSFDGEHIYPPALAVKGYDSIGEGKKRVVLATAHIAAWMEMRAALANDNPTGSNCFAAIDLQAQALTV
jgi:hypothetical protein